MKIVMMIFALLSFSSLSHAYTPQCFEKAQRLVKLDKEFWRVSSEFDNETNDELKKRSLVNELNVLEDQTALAFLEAQKACGPNIPGY